VARITLNVLDKAVAHRVRPPLREPVTAAGPVQSPPEGQWVQRVEAFAGQAGTSGFRDGPAAEALFKAPTGPAVTPAGEVVVADTGNNRIRLIQPGPTPSVITLGGNGNLGHRDGAGAQAMFRYPTAVAVGLAGELYVADSENHVIRVLEKDAAGGWTVRTVAGIVARSGFADGVPAKARFNRPMSLAVDSAGNLYIADQVGNRIRMLRADRSGGLLTGRHRRGLGKARDEPRLRRRGGHRRSHGARHQRRWAALRERFVQPHHPPHHPVVGSGAVPLGHAVELGEGVVQE
jgi:hypothetical protein